LPDPIVTGLLAFALATALIASALGQTLAPEPPPQLVNRTAEAIADLQDLAPPDAETHP
jgi:hypothetical protein